MIFVVEDSEGKLSTLNSDQPVTVIHSEEIEFARGVATLAAKLGKGGDGVKLISEWLNLPEDAAMDLIVATLFWEDWDRARV